MKSRKALLLGLPIMLIAMFAGFWGLRTVFADPSDARVTTRYAETSEVLANPYTGFSIDARGDGGEQPFTLAHANVSWAELEPVKGRYDFEAFEQAIQLARWEEAGVRLIVRVVLDYPQEQTHMDIPEWLYEEIGKKGVWYDNDYGKGFSPDYAQPALIRYHSLLIEALGKRYDSNPAIAFIQLGSLGHWGEWHTWDGDDPVIPFPKRKVADQYVVPYIMNFKNKPLLMRRPHAIAQKFGLGLFNDAFGDKSSTVNGFYRWFTKGYVSWLTQEKEPAMPNFWVKSPSGGEFAGGDRYFRDGAINETIRQARLTHVTWMGPRAPYDAEKDGPLQANIDRFLRTIGYRYVIAETIHEQSVKSGNSLKIDMRILNRGVAPFYFAWPLELSLIDEAGEVAARYATKSDIRKWLPGSSVEQQAFPVPADLPPGVYTIAAAIIDPNTGLPGIRFAMENKRDDGRYPLDVVKIENES